MGARWFLPLPLQQPSNSRQPSNGSAFEDLSNDLLLEFFDYFWSHEIYLSFGHLNNRFDSLIDNYPQHVNFRLTTIIPRYFRSLQVNARYQVPLFLAFDQQQTSSIRSLTLANLRSQQMFNVLNAVDMKRLEYVYLGVDYERFENKESLYIHVLSLGEYRLHRCHLRGCLFNIDNLPLSLPALRYLHLESCKDFSILSSLLSCLPNLKFLEVSISNSTNNPLQSISCPMTHLILRPHRNCSTKEISKFLTTCCSHLKKLVIEMSIENGNTTEFLMNKQEWSKILPRQITWFHLKAISNSINNITHENFHRTQLHDKIWLIGNESCEVMVDVPHLFKW